MTSVFKKCTLGLTVFINVFFFSPNNLAAQRILNLEECLELAIEHNLGIKVSDEMANVATSLRKASYTKFFPSVDIIGNYTRLNREFHLLQNDLLLPVIPISAIDPVTGEVDMNRLFDPNISPPPTGVVFKPDSDDYYTDADGNPVFYRYTWLPQNHLNFGVKNTYFLNVGLMQPLFTGGKIRAQYNITQYIESISDNEKRLETFKVIFETKELFYTLISVQEKKELAVKYKEMLDSLASDVENIYEEGFILQNDLLKVKVKQNEAEMWLLRAENGVKLATAALNRTLGLPLNESLIIDHQIEITEVFKSLDELINEALNGRPEIDMANNIVGISSAVERIAKARFYPDVAFSANYFFANPNPYSGFAQEFGHDYAFGITMRIPIYDWNEKGHILQAARHGRKAQELKYKDALNLIELEVTKLYFELTEGASRVILTESSLNKAKINLEFAESKYEEGSVTSSSLLEAKIIWQQANTEYIEAKADYQIALASLNKAIGKMP